MSIELTKEEVFKKVADIIHDQTSVGRDKIKMESRFTDDLHCDSLDVAEISMEIDEQFDVQMEDEQSNQQVTVGQVVEHIMAEKAKKS